MDKNTLSKMSGKEIQNTLDEMGYFANLELAMAIRNSAILDKPILVEGPPGVGKTELAKVMAKVMQTDMVRLQCSPEMNEKKALYDFDYAKQLLYIQLLKDEVFEDGKEPKTLKGKISKLNKSNPFYSEDFLIKRPVLKAFQEESTSVLLIDELDKAEEEIEYSLLEAFSDYSISVPEIGTIEAKNKPITIITSNRKRKISDTLARRCIYVYLEYPSIEDEVKILKNKVGASDKLTKEVAMIMNTIRSNKLAHVPSIAESVEWLEVLKMHVDENLTKDDLLQTMSVIAKTPSDREKIKKIILG